MRAVVYVPADEPRTRWYLRRGKAECKRLGHEYLGPVATPAEAAAARASGLAETVVAHPAHIRDLVPWLHVVPPGSRPSAAAGLALLPLAWDTVKAHPVRLATVAAVVAGAGAAMVMLPVVLGPDDDRQVLLPPRSPPVVVEPAPASTRPTEPRPTITSPQPTGGGGEVLATPDSPRPVITPAVPLPPVAPPVQPSPPVASPTPAVPPSPVQPSSPPVVQCLVRLEVPGISVVVCLR